MILEKRKSGKNKQYSESEILNQYKIKYRKLGVVVYIFNLSIQKAGTWIFLSLWPAWST